MTIHKALGEESGNRWQIFLEIQLLGALAYIISSMEGGRDPALVGELVTSDGKFGYLYLDEPSASDIR